MQNYSEETKELIDSTLTDMINGDIESLHRKVKLLKKRNIEMYQVIVELNNEQIPKQTFEYIARYGASTDVWVLIDKLVFHQSRIDDALYVTEITGDYVTLLDNIVYDYVVLLYNTREEAIYGGIPIVKELIHRLKGKVTLNDLKFIDMDLIRSNDGTFIKYDILSYIGFVLMDKLDGVNVGVLKKLLEWALRCGAPEELINTYESHLPKGDYCVRVVYFGPHRTKKEADYVSLFSDIDMV